MKNELGNHDFKGILSPTHQRENSHNESDLELATGNKLFPHDENLKQHHTYIDMESFLKAKAEFSIKDNTSNPGPLAIFGFGLTTCLLSLHNAGVFPLNVVVFAMAFCYGGLAQIIGGLFEWYKGKMFTSVVFISYGLFWWSFALLFILPAAGVADKLDPIGMGFYLFLWGVFSFVFLICSLNKPKIFFLIFLTVVLVFWLLAIENWSEDKRCGKAAGVIGVICSILAMYAATGELVNGNFGRTIIPMGAPTIKETKFKA